MKKVMLTAVAAAMLALPSVAGAVCVKAGYVDRVTTIPGNGNSAIYVRTGSTAGFTYSAVTKDAKLIDAALTAVTSRTRVQIKGSAARCPTRGTIRNAGVLQYLILAP